MRQSNAHPSKSADKETGLKTTIKKDDNSLKTLLLLAWRCWPYYRLQLRHIITFVVLNSLIGVAILGFTMLSSDLIENKILLGERLQPVQAQILFLDNTFVTSGEGDNEKLSSHQRKQVRLNLIILGALCWVIFTAYTAAMWYYMVWIFQSVNQQLRSEMLSRAEHLSLKYHSSSRTGDAIYRVYQDSATITNVLQFVILTPLRILTWVGFAAIVLIFFSPWFGLIFIVAAFLIAGIMRALLPHVREKARLSRENNSALTSNIQETLTAIRVIKANGAENRMMDKFRADSQSALDAAFDMRLFMSLLLLSTSIVAFGAVMIAEYFMATWAMHEKATHLGGVVALVGYAAWNLGAFKAASAQAEESASSIWELAFTLSYVQDIVVGLKRAFFLLELEPEVADPEKPQPFPTNIKSIRFDQVRFGYEEGKNILDEINMSVESGSITAIVGTTGSGKSTLMSLLLRLYEPLAGRVLFNGFDLRNMSKSDVRSNVAIALQQNILFAKNITENICYGRDDITQIAVVNAAKIACAHDFILEMPDGYETELGERGAKLSTGQRQRISIARAILRDTPILILDEPTASLDAETERRVMQNLAAWGRNRVIFIVTHRLSTISSADKIALLEDGRIKEFGNHPDLMAKAGGYKDFVDAESIGARDETKG